MSNYVALIEHEEGRVRRASLEALGVARRIASAKGGKTIALIAGNQIEALAQEVASRGADEVIALTSEHLNDYTPDGYRLAMEPVIRELMPEWVVMGHTYMASDLTPLISASFDAPVLTDCVDVEVDADPVVFMRQPYDAKFVARTVDRGPAPHFATLQAGAFPADDLPEGHGGTVTERAVSLEASQLRRTVKEIRSTGGGAVDLSGAEVIVAGGRGLGSKEKFLELVGGLAEALDGAIGASRPVVDAEWLPHEHQIGSSGQIVSPRLYVSLGVSGAIQHVVGIRGAQCIVAINKDKDAPIFNESTYGIVGDVEEVVPALIEAVKEARG